MGAIASLLGAGSKIGARGVGRGIGFMYHSLFSMKGSAPQIATKVARHDYLGSLAGLSEYVPTGKVFGKGIGGLGGAFLKKFAPYYAAGEGIDYVLNETRTGEEMSGAGRLALGAVGLGFKLNAYRHLARGATGSALYAAGRATGNPARFADQYHMVAGKLNALPGKVGAGILKGAGHAAMLPLRAAVGVPYAAASALRVGGNLFGNAMFGRWSPVGSTAGFLMRKVGAGRAAEGMFKFMESRSIMKQIHPTMAGWIPGLRGTKFGGAEAPIYSGMVALGAGAAIASKFYQHKRENQAWATGPVGPNPANYGMGISTMRRGGARNYGPALTLMLHQNHSRVMP